MVDCKSQEGIVGWLVRAVNPAAASGSWENVVEHGVYLAAGDVRTSIIHFGLTKPQTAASLWPCRSALISIHSHPMPGDPPQSHQHVPVQVAAAQAAPEPPPPSATCPAPGHLSPAAKHNIPTVFMCYKRTVSGRLIQVIVEEQSHALCIGNGFFPASTPL